MRHPSYLAYLPLSASFFTGEGTVLSNAIKSAATSVISPVRPVPSASLSGASGWR